MKEPVTGCYVRRLATAVPTGCVDPREAARLLQHTCVNERSRKLLPRLIRLSGIEKRHAAILDKEGQSEKSDLFYPAAEIAPHGPDMAMRTAMFAELADPLVERVLSGFPRDELTRINRLVTVSCTHASSPGLEQPVFAHTPIPRTVDRWNLGFMGCSAGLAAVRLIHQMSANGGDSLVLCCELSSLHFQYTDKLDQMTANVLFADGAAALILSERASPVRVVDCACLTVPESAQQMVWLAGNHGLELKLSPDLGDTLAAALPEAIGRFLAGHDLCAADVHHWLVHPGGPQILDAVGSALALGDDALDESRAILRNYGNMSSPTIFFIIEALLSSGAAGWTVAMAFGPGLTIELVLLRVSER